jgi:hypothetical protein
MALSQQNFLRLQVMMTIQHPESYYQTALKSNGIDYTTLTHPEICAHIAAMKALEADIMIEIAEELPKAESVAEMNLHI